MYQPKPNLAARIVQKLMKSRIFPASSITKLVLGAWWIVEPFIIELPIASAFLTKYQWEILGPINIALFLSTLFAVTYGALCLGAGYVQWMSEHAAKKKL
jgi:hypothetical protein